MLIAKTIARHDRKTGDRETGLEELARNSAQNHRDQETDDRPDRRQEDRLDQELDQDVAVLGANRLAQTDLKEPLGERDLQHRENADPTDDQRDRRDGEEDDRPSTQLLVDLLLGLEDLLGNVFDLEILDPVVLPPQTVLEVGEELAESCRCRRP